jgi:Sortase domain
MERFYKTGVTDGARTHNRWSHNPELCLLSYGHHKTRCKGADGPRLPSARNCSIGSERFALNLAFIERRWYAVSRSYAAHLLGGLTVTFRTLSRATILALGCLALPLSSGMAATSKPGHSGGVAKKHTHAPAHVAVPAGWPRFVMIPKLHVKAPVESLDLSKATPLHAPYRWGDVAWYSRGPRPGALGRASVYGHLDSTCCPAVFWHLKDLKPGDIAQVQYKTGNPLKFKVLWKQNYANNKLPMKFMFGPSREHGLVLITCSGVFHTDGTGYDHKLVVYARLLLPNGQLG